MMGGQEDNKISGHTELSPSLHNKDRGRSVASWVTPS